eukprot:97294_1
MRQRCRSVFVLSVFVIITMTYWIIFLYLKQYVGSIVDVPIQTTTRNQIHVSININQSVINPNNNQQKIATDIHLSLLIIGSTNGGTSLLNDLYSTILKSFYNRNKRSDTYYWSRCIPCNEYKTQTTNYSNWNVKENNLCSHKHKRIQQIHCTKHNYMNLITDNKYKQLIKDKKLFIADRCSEYNQMPYVSKMIATFFPETVLLYTIRESLSQRYSRFKNFRINKKRNKVTDTEYFSQSFMKLLKEIQSDYVQNGLLPLLKSTDQNDNIKDEIIFWYLNYPYHSYRLSNDFAPFKIAFGDLCPYVNVIMYMKILNIYNIKYSYYKLKIVQS